MSNIAKLKMKAAEFERKKQPDKALAVYIELLAEYEASPEEMDVALYNRVGDLLLKQGNVADAVDYYERAVDHYADGGFHNNAIALCNKILRQSPGRTNIYYKLGKISAQKGFAAEAKRNFLEFADRKEKAGKLDEAFNALREFADLCPDQDDIRLMLADQLQKAGKASEAVQQLQVLYQRYSAEGRRAEADATAERIRSIDPSAEVRVGDTPLETKAQDLIFLDLNEAPRPPRGSTMRPVEPPPPPPAQPVPAPSPEPAAPVQLEHTSMAEGLDATQVGAEALDGVTRADLTGGVELSPDHASPLEGLQATSFDQRATGAIPASLLDLEPTSMAEPEEAPEAAAQPDAEPAALPDLAVGAADDLASSAPVAAEQPGSAAAGDEDLGGDLELIMPDPTPSAPARPTPVAAAPAVDLPFMDLDGEEPAEAAPTPAPAPAPEPARASGAIRTSGVGRASTMMAAQSVETLQAVVDGAPTDWDAHRELGEAMLEAGDRDAGLRALESAMKGYEGEGNLDAATSVADEIVRADPSSVKIHQKRVEFAYRTSDKHRLVDAYLDLADALSRSEQGDKARTIYHRVLEISPENARAVGALQSLPDTPVDGVPAAPAPGRGGTPSSVPAASAGDFVNLGDLMREDEPEKDTRMVVEEEEPTGDEAADFADMLRKFKQGVADNVDAEDHQAHYDLGVAYKEMGLLDEAISEFQKALRAAENRGRTYEAIGQCFMEKEQFQMANTLLARALHEPGMSDDKLVGVLYLLGRANEALSRPAQALEYYQRVFVIDVQFRDVGERMNALEQAAR